MPAMSQRVTGFGTTIFSDINALAIEHQAVNLAKGRRTLTARLKC